MKRLMAAIVCFALLQPFIYGQSQTAIDSLTKVLQAATTDTARITAQNKLVKEYLLQNDSAKAVNLAYHSLALAKNTPYLYYKAYADQIVGYIHTVLLHEDSAMFYNNSVLTRLKGQTSNEYLQLIVYATNNLASNHAFSGNIKASGELLISNLPRLEKIKDKRAYEITMQNIAACFNNLGEFRKAYPYMIKSIALADVKENPPIAKVQPYLTGAMLMYGLDSIDRMGEYLDKIEENLDLIGHSTPFTGRYYTYKAKYYAKFKRLKEAGVQLALAFKELKTFSSRTNFYDYYSAKRDVALAASNNHEVKDAAMHQYQMAREDRYIEQVINASKVIATASAKLGDYKTAYEYLEKYAALGDSVGYNQTILDVHALETKYQTAEKEKEITRLQAEKQQAQLQHKNQQLLNWLLGAGIGALLLITLFLVYVYRNSRKHAAQQFREMEQGQELRLTQAMLEGEERERTRVARDLHDGLGGTLSGIRLKLAGGRKNDMAVVDDAIVQLEGSIDELRRIARNMMPEGLVKFGLETALRDLCSSLSGNNRQIIFQASGISKTLTLVTQVNVYRIIQELLSNAIRHGHATNIIVQCIQNDKTFLITVEDNGQGFDLDGARQAKGIGLGNVHNRVSYLKGKLDIRSAVGEGTSANIELSV